MKDHRDIAERVFSRGDELNAEKKRKNTLIRRTVISFSGLCAAAICFGVWNSAEVKNAANLDKFNSVSDIIEDTDDIRTTVPTAVSTAGTSSVTTAVSTSAKTTHTEAVAATVPVSFVNTDAPRSILTAAETQPERTEPQILVETTITSPTSTTPTVLASTCSITITAQTTAITTAITSPQTTYITSTAAPQTITRPYENQGPVNDEGFFGRVIFEGKDYTNNKEYRLSEDIIGEKLGECEVSRTYENGYKGKNENITSNAEIFAVEDVSQKFVIALKYEDCDEYYSYKSRFFAPSTLGEFIDSCGLGRYLTVSKALYNADRASMRTVTYDVKGGDLLWEYALTDRDMPSVMLSSIYQIEYTLSDIRFTASLPDLGFSGDIYFSKHGYMHTTISPTPISFFIGEETVGAIIKEVTENYPIIK